MLPRMSTDLLDFPYLGYCVMTYTFRAAARRVQLRHSPQEPHQGLAAWRIQH